MYNIHKRSAFLNIEYMKKTTIIESISILYIILFLYTGISKIIDYPIFKEQIALSPILAPIARLVAILIPIIEFAIVVMLIVPRWRLKGFYSSAVLMTIFTIYIIFLLSFSKELPCSCGGIISELSWGQHVIFNSAFLLMAIIAIFLKRKIGKINQQQFISILNV
jgi:uncharacterized membrane protein YphA (DoxX/SURF4 family)